MRVIQPLFLFVVTCSHFVVTLVTTKKSKYNAGYTNKIIFVVTKLNINNIYSRREKKFLLKFVFQKKRLNFFYIFTLIFPKSDYKNERDSFFFKKARLHLPIRRT